jgi:purine-nucleoside phosphorylase
VATGHAIDAQRAWHARHASHRTGEIVAAIRARTRVVPRVAIVLGSGLGGVLERVTPKAPAGSGADAPSGADFETATLPHWPRSTVPGHAGRLRLGYWGAMPVAMLAGRSHPYEGYGPDVVTLPVRVLAALGAQVLLLTNAVGATRTGLSPGSLMLVRDHLNFQHTRGLFLPEELAPAADRGAFGARPVYAERLARTLRDTAREQHIALEVGVLAGGLGPAYETASEVAMLRRFGADAACMSTVMEALVGAGLGLEVAAISCVTNAATGVALERLTHEEVLAVAGEARARLGALLEAALPRIDEAPAR